MKNANPAIIGAFVLGALALGIMGIIIFGGGLFKETKQFVLVFDTSLKGLGPGSQVTFRGVPVGEVKRIHVLIDTETGRSLLPVYIEIDPQRLTAWNMEKGAERKERSEPGKIVEHLIRKGLRAQLQFQSLVTGRLLVDLGFYPDTPVALANIDNKVMEIPTVPSAVDHLAKRLEQIPFDQLVHTMTNTINNVDRILSSGKIEKALDQFTGAMSETRTTLKELRPMIQETIVSISAASEAAKSFMHTGDSELKTISGAARQLQAKTSLMMEQLNSLLSNLSRISDTSSPEMYRLKKALEELAMAARGIRTLTEMIEENPDILIRGRAYQPESNITGNQQKTEYEKSKGEKDEGKRSN